MKACVWYDMEEKSPPRSGYYLAFKGMSMGDDDTDCDYYYWNAKEAQWSDSQHYHAHYANVIYWTDADPGRWYDNYNRQDCREMSVAEKDAWDAVKAAIERYEVVKNLAKV